jgi:hypothetical protein
MSPYFSLSDKGRDAAQKVALFSLMVVFFSGFNIQLVQIPIFNIPLPLQADNPAHQVPTVASIFQIIALYYVLVLIGVFLGEYSNHVDQANQKLTPGVFVQSLVIGPDQQQIQAGINQSKDRNWRLARWGSWIRVGTDFILPLGLCCFAAYLELGHTVRAIYQLL